MITSTVKISNISFIRKNFIEKDDDGNVQKELITKRVAHAEDMPFQ